MQSKKENIIIVEDIDEFSSQDLRILKSLVQDRKLAKEFIDGIYPIDFFKGRTFQFATWFLQHFKINNSLPTKRILSETYPEQKELFNEIFSRLEKTEFDPLEFGYDLEKLKNRYAKEQFLKLKDIDFNDSNWEREFKKVDVQLNKIKSLNKTKQKEYFKKSGREYINEFVDNYVNKVKNPKFDRGILTGYSYFDYVTNGLLDTDLLIIAGISSSGKSQLLNNIAVQMWMQTNTIHSERFVDIGHNILYFTLEMPFKNCFRRTMAKLADVPVNSIRDACLTPDELERFGKAAQFFKHYPYDFEIIDVPRGLTVDKLEEIYLEDCDNKPKEKRAKVIGIDYLGLMDDEEEVESDWLKLGKITGELHEFLRRYGLIGLTAVQLNDPGQKKEPSEMIGLHRIGRSKLIMHHATHGIQIETRQDEHLYSDFPYHLIKVRDGEKGSHTITKNFRNSSIIDIPYVPFENIEGNQQEDFSEYALEFFDKLEL